jgi:hypothetical protein
MVTTCGLVLISLRSTIPLAIIIIIIRFWSAAKMWLWEINFRVQ